LSPSSKRMKSIRIVGGAQAPEQPFPGLARCGAAQMGDPRVMRIR
jgi:hypothetical protein